MRNYIKGIFIDIFTNTAATGLLASLCIIALCWQKFTIFWTSPFIQSWDGAAHFAASLHYSQTTFPSVWGWTSQWFTGMPFPQFYPPLFFFLTAVLYHIFFFIKPIIIFKVFITTLQASIPFIIIGITKKITRDNTATALSAIVTVVILSTSYRTLGDYGVTVSSTIHTGMYAHLIAAIFFLFWIYYLPSINLSKRHFLISALLLAGLALSNAHMVLPAIIFFIVSCCLAIAPKIKNIRVASKVLGIYSLNGVWAIAITACWSLPLVMYYSYLNTYPPTQPPQLTALLLTVPILGLTILAGTYIGYRFGNKFLQLFATSSLLLLPITLLQYTLGNIGLVAHAGRWLAVLFFLNPILVGLIYTTLVHQTLFFKKYSKLFFVLIIGIIFMWHGSWSWQYTTGIYYSYNQDRMAEIVSYIKNNPSSNLLQIEPVFIGQQPSAYITGSILGEYVPITTFNLRESAISAIFLEPVRSTLSLSYDAWGTVSFLTSDLMFRNQSATVNVNRALHLGIDTFLIRSPFAKAQIEHDARIKLEKRFGPWSLYRTTTNLPRAYSVQSEPVIFYGPFSFKGRQIDDYDWSRLQEVLLYHNNSTTTLIYANNQSLDSSPELLSSPSFISSYKYKNIDQAFNRIIKSAQQHRIILVADDTNSLFKKIQEFTVTHQTPNITIIPRLHVQYAEPDPLNKQLPDVLQSVTNTKYNSAIVTAAIIRDKKINIKLSTTTTPVPILIQNSYHPAWQRPDGQPVFLSNPSYMLTYATSSFEIDFTTPPSVYLGWLISIITTVTSLILLRTLKSTEW